MLIDWRKEVVRKDNRVMISGKPIAMHCHHYNVNLHKTLEDTLGNEGVRLLATTAETSAYTSFSAFLSNSPKIRTVKSKLEVAAIIYQNGGLGIIHFTKIDTDGGWIHSPSSHHVTGWLAKYGRRETPGCHFARGWIAGILAAIYDRDVGYYAVEELGCKMARDKICTFRARARGEIRGN